MELGKQQSEEFEAGWPHSFYNPIPRIIQPMTVSGKFIAVRSSKIFDCGVLYARAMGLQCSQRENTTTINGLLATELDPVATSMFDEKGHMEITMAKSQLKNDMKVECSQRHTSVSTFFLDGCAVLWTVPWTSLGTVKDFLDAFRAHLLTYLRSTYVYLVFDR